jgi:hypothetical protein
LGAFLNFRVGHDLMASASIEGAGFGKAMLGKFFSRVSDWKVIRYTGVYIVSLRKNYPHISCNFGYTYMRHHSLHMLTVNIILILSTINDVKRLLFEDASHSKM